MRDRIVRKTAGKLIKQVESKVQNSPGLSFDLELLKPDGKLSYARANIVLKGRRIYNQIFLTDDKNELISAGEPFFRTFSLLD